MEDCLTGWDHSVLVVGCLALPAPSSSVVSHGSLRGDTLSVQTGTCDHMVGSSWSPASLAGQVSMEFQKQWSCRPQQQPVAGTLFPHSSCFDDQRESRGPNLG